jgi:DNA polymerase I
MRRRFKSIFDQIYSRLRWWQLEQHREAEQKGKIKTVGGRLVSFQNPAMCYTDSRNYPIQAAAADLQLLAIQRVHTTLLEQGLPAYLVNFIHDELVLEVRDDYVADVRNLLTREMTQAFLGLLKSFDPDPLSRELVEVGVGHNYAEVK